MVTNWSHQPPSANPAPIRSESPPLHAKRARKARTAFTDAQLTALEINFTTQKYLSVTDRQSLAARLQLSDTQVKTWYQNRRLVATA